MSHGTDPRTGWLANAGANASTGRNGAGSTMTRSGGMAIGQSNHAPCKPRTVSSWVSAASAVRIGEGWAISVKRKMRFTVGNASTRCG